MLTVNEHILTEFWLQIVEVAITSVGMSVQGLTTDYVHYFTIYCSNECKAYLTLAPLL